ncbi:MAG: mechanosensitive ion channel family protein [Deltaproteobacteria bacterium]|nr:mechanosensitive ion channel family protein [Deltaproteobacteria bacterium]
MGLEKLFNAYPLLQNTASQMAVILVIYAILAKAVDLFISRGLSRLAALSKMNLDDQIVAVIHRPIYWTVFGLGILHALEVGAFSQPWQFVLPGLTKSFILLTWIITIFSIMRLALQQSTIESLLRRKIPATAFSIIKKIIRLIILAVAVVWLLGVWNVNLTPFFASAGIAGIALAMAAKDSLANFFGGISIFMDNIFKEGDYIVLDSGERGEVLDVGMRSTRIVTRDDIQITIPNSILANTKIINESAPIPRFRIKVPVGVAYGSEADAVEEVLLSSASNNLMVSKEPVPRVRFRLLGQSSIDFDLLCWVEDPRQKGLITHELLKTIYTALQEADIAIPFPQLDVHIKGQE